MVCWTSVEEVGGKLAHWAYLSASNACLDGSDMEMPGDQREGLSVRHRLQQKLTGILLPLASTWGSDCQSPSGLDGPTMGDLVQGLQAEQEELESCQDSVFGSSRTAE